MAASVRLKIRFHKEREKRERMKRKFSNNSSSSSQQREFLQLYNFYVNEKRMDPNEAAAKTIETMTRRRTSMYVFYFLFSRIQT